MTSKLQDEEKLKRGDIVLNGWASEGFNDLHVIVGSITCKTGQFSTTTYYECRMLFEGKLKKHKSLFSKTDNRLTKIGHIDLDAAIIAEMIKAR